MATSEQQILAEIGRLGHRLRRFLKDAPGPEVVATEPDYLAMVDIFAAEALSTTTAALFAFSENGAVANAALEGFRKNGSRCCDVASTVARRIGDVPSFAMEQALRLIADHHSSVPAGLPIVRLAMASRLQKNGWAGGPLGRALDWYVTWYQSLGSSGEIELGEDITPLGEDERRALRIWLRKMAGLPAESEASSQNAVFDRVGTFWNASSIGPYVSVGAWDEARARAIRAHRSAPPRSVLIVGEPGIGKTTFLKSLFLEAADEGWRVIEAGSQSFIADNIYIGQTEGLIRSMVNALELRHKIVWLVPDLLTFAQAGTYKHNAASLLEQILPALQASQIVLWAECDPKGVERLFRLQPALRRCLEVVTLEPVTASATTALVAQLGDVLSARSTLHIEPSASQLASELADRYLSPLALPGAALGVLQRACDRAVERGRVTVARTEVAETMAELSGLPMSILNGDEALDVSALSRFFSGRVIGQSDAVKSVVDRIVMLKGGLNDPRKPIGTLLFAGPTGTGKTELAKAAAEYLFGDPQRLLRLDMSEFRLEQSTQKILGGPWLPEPGETLIDKIRRQPYSVLLLDEFEKAHPLVWDLFLQLLDEGRLTDFKGATADFRNCLIILTTNLGATPYRRSSLGFQAGAATGSVSFSADEVRSTIASVFRPEFQNRFDAIVVFTPLTRAVMKQILVKELERLYERRGLRQRGWVAGWEASAIEFLLERGFHPEMGARPLKRAIDEYVAVPLATAIVENRAPPSEHFAFFRSDGRAIQVEFVDPNDGPASIDVPPPDHAERKATSIMLAARPSRGDVVALGRSLTNVADRLNLSDWVEAKRELLSLMGAEDFWGRNDRRDVLTRFEVMDRLEMAVASATALCGRLTRRQASIDDGWRHDLTRLATQVVAVEDGLIDWKESSPVDVVIRVEDVLQGNSATKSTASGWCRRLSDMYKGWAGHRQLLYEQINAAGQDVALIAGFGAFRTLSAEAGLHVWEYTGADSHGQTTRIVARVIVASVSDVEGLRPGDQRESVLAALELQPRLNGIVRRYRRWPSPLVRSGDGKSRTGKLAAVLSGQLEVLGADDE